MKHAILRASLASLVGLLAAGAAVADTVVDTTPSWDGVANLNPFGVTGTSTYGQTITAPIGDSALQSFEFFIKGPSTQSFRGYVYAWDGAEATGSALYTSPTMSLAGTGDFEGITFATGGVNLTPGSQYVLFASVSDPAVFSSSTGRSKWGQPQAQDVYAGGALVFLNDGGNPSSWTSVPWTQDWLGQGADMAFKATFGSASVPEPSSLALIAIGASAGLLRFCRRRRASA